MTSKMKIAVYMGSFNPMHIGHLTVIRYLLDKSGFDRVYLIVSPQNPFKDKELADSAQKRYSDAVLAVERAGLGEKVLVDDIELSMGYPSWSIRTLDALKKREPSNRFTLVIGGDNLHEMLDWKEGGRILMEYGVVVYPREGYNIVHDTAVLKRQHKNEEVLLGGSEVKHRPYHIKLLKDAPPVNVSSTMIRNMITEGKDVSHLLA